MSEFTLYGLFDVTYKNPCLIDFVYAIDSKYAFSEFLNRLSERYVQVYFYPDDYISFTCFKPDNTYDFYGVAILSYGFIKS